MSGHPPGKVWDYQHAEMMSYKEYPSLPRIEMLSPQHHPMRETALSNRQYSCKTNPVYRLRDKLYKMSQAFSLKCKTLSLSQISLDSLRPELLKKSTQEI